MEGVLNCLQQRARSLGTDELAHSRGDKQRGETIEELRNDEPQVGVVDWVVCCFTRCVKIIGLNRML